MKNAFENNEDIISEPAKKKWKNGAGVVVPTMLNDNINNNNHPRKWKKNTTKKTKSPFISTLFRPGHDPMNDMIQFLY